MMETRSTEKNESHDNIPSILQFFIKVCEISAALLKFYSNHQILQNNFQKRYSYLIPQRRPPQENKLRVDDGDREGAERPQVRPQQSLSVAVDPHRGRRLEEDEAAQGQRRLGRRARPRALPQHDPHARLSAAAHLKEKKRSVTLYIIHHKSPLDLYIREQDIFLALSHSLKGSFSYHRVKGERTAEGAEGAHRAPRRLYLEYAFSSQRVIRTPRCVSCACVQTMIMVINSVEARRTRLGSCGII